jgi:cytochrome c biogenesis protein CcmG/thiol:disulfide interchange protein DsbE
MKLKKKWLPLIMAGLLIEVGAALSYSSPVAAQKVRPAKEFSLKDLSSKKVSLSDFRGKVILLNFFTTWCPPCRIEIPELVKIHQQNKNKGLVVLGVSLDKDVVPFMLKNFVKDMKIPYPVLMGTEEVADTYLITGVPVTVVITKDGKVHKRFDGLASPDQLEKALKDLLET